jgi:hypothetical protein
MFLSIIECVSLFVLTTQDGRFGGEKLVVRKEVGLGWVSPYVFFRVEKSIVGPFNRGGVPVFSRPTRKPNCFNEAVIPVEASSPILPAEDLFVPT